MTRLVVTILFLLSMTLCALASVTVAPPPEPTIHSAPLRDLGVAELSAHAPADAPPAAIEALTASPPASLFKTGSDESVFAVAAHPEAPSPAPSAGGDDSSGQTGAASSLVPISERRAAARQRKQQKKRARKNASKRQRSKTERRRRRKSRRSRRKASLSEDSTAATEVSDKPTKRGATSGDGARFEAGKAQLSPALAAAQSLAASESKRQRRRAADSDEEGSVSKRQRRRRRRRNGSDRKRRGASGSSSASGASSSTAHHEQSAHDARESELELRRARRHPDIKLVDAEAETRHEIRSERSQQSERTHGKAAKGGREETTASNGDPLVPAKKVSGGGHHGPLNKISSRSRVSGRSKRERRERRGGRQEHMPLAYYAGGKSRSGGKTSVRTQQKRSKAMREQYEEELREEQNAKFERIDRSRWSSQRE